MKNDKPNFRIEHLAIEATNTEEIYREFHVPQKSMDRSDATFGKLLELMDCNCNNHTKRSCDCNVECKCDSHKPCNHCRCDDYCRCDRDCGCDDACREDCGCAGGY